MSAWSVAHARLHCRSAEKCCVERSEQESVAGAVAGVSADGFNFRGFYQF